MPDLHTATEEHELPGLEALLAATLALMTGYGQALQAAVDPQRRLAMGVRVADNLALLTQQAQLSAGFRDVADSLAQRWQTMNHSTVGAAADCHAARPLDAARWPPHLPAPKRLQ